MNADTPILSLSFARARSRIRDTDRSLVFALILLAAIAIPCLLAPVAAPYDPNAQPDIVGLRSVPPSLAHPMGTDPVSRDVLSRLLYGGRLSLSVALFATLVSVTLGTAYGAIAGYTDGIAGTILERLLDALLAIPRLLLLIAIFALWRDIPITGFIVILGATGWYGLARLVRGQVLALKRQDFVASAAALGAGRMRILTRHILPNVTTPVIVAAMLGIGHIIVLEAGLSFLGLGVHQPTASWGNMIQDGSDQIANHWWISLFPGLAIILTVIAFNILGDALLRVLSPRQSRFE
ncbi:MAG TPA: ABC transporter permease [Gemmatimonadaceae bacterium]